MNQIKNPSNGEQLDLFTASSVLGSTGDAREVLGSSIDAMDLHLIPNTSPVPGTAINPSKALEYKWIRRGEKLHGPYLYLRWRENGRQRSQYIGKALCDPRLAKPPEHR